MNKKITGLRVLELKKRIKIKEDNKLYFKYLIHNLNFKLSKSSILGIFSSDSETKKMIFDLLVNNKIQENEYQGFIEFNQEDNKYFLVSGNDNYKRNLAYGFDDNNLFENKTKETLFSYLEKYIKNNKSKGLFSNIFSKNWKDIYQDSEYHFKLEYARLNHNLQLNIEPLLDEIKIILDDNSDCDLDKFDRNDQILFIQKLLIAIRKIVKIIQNSEQSFFDFVESTIKDYESGNSLMKYKEYKEAKTKYNEIYNKKNIIKHRVAKNDLWYKIKNSLEILKLKNFKKEEVRKYFIKLKQDFLNEKKFNHFYLKNNFNPESFVHYYSRYYISKIYYKFFRKYYSQIQLLNHKNFIDLVSEIYDLRDNTILEINSLATVGTKYQLKKQIQYVANSILSNTTKMYFDRFRLFKQELEEQTQEIVLKSQELEFTKVDDYINISQLKNYEYDLAQKQAEYHWNVDNLGKEIRNETKNLISKSNSTFFSNIEKSKLIYKRINQILGKLFDIHKEEFSKDKQLELILLNPFFKSYFDLKELNYLVNNLFLQFIDYKKIFEVTDYEDFLSKFFLKSNIYKILLNSDISLDKLAMNLSYLTIDEKISLEFNKILINNPSLIIIGNNIDKLSEENQFKILNKINSYILANEAIGIYFLNNINVASKLTTDINIIMNSKTIEQGKTNIIVDNPINPVVKRLLNKEDEKSKTLYDDFLSKIDDFENIFKYEIEPDHFVWCKWYQLTKWINSKNTQNKKFRDLFSFDENNKIKKNEFVDKRNYTDQTIIDFSLEESKQKGDAMEKNFDHKIVEEGRNQKWIDMQAFSTHDISKPPFTIILPPPNVTGKLHIGHALDTYIQDTVIRYKKIKGFDVMWVAGKDHAGIATQAVVEKKLAQSNINKYQLGREKFVEEIWKWKDEYSNNITSQWAKLGLALDYTSERFTLDKQANEAVLKVFVDMYNNGLIYRDTKAIIWDTKLKTALSNIEVIPNETKQKMYYIKYPIKDSKEQYLLVATTRVETMFSDVALALNPTDKRYNELKDKLIVHPLTKREIPIISSESIYPSFGTGVMKVSAHAIEDIEIIKANKLEVIECIDDEGKMNSFANQFEGMDRFEARIEVANFLKSKGFIERIEDVISNVGYSERSKEPIEILVKPQWFVKMKSLSEKLLKNLESSEGVKIIPYRFKDNLVNWMENVHDWTISRQIWWGHRIPAWYRDNEVLVQVEKPGDGWIQESDVLDTWFSSALAPFVFLGWPQSTEKVKRYFPTSLLVTGYDIIFFWVSRMYFQSLEFMDEIPFKEVLLHGLVRDSKGRKMSKSLGNGIDPIKVIDQYGSDVLKMSLIFNCTPGLDINFGDEKIQAARLFINKIWNIARLVKNVPINLEEKIDYTKLDEFDNWILSEFNNMVDNIDSAMEKYEFTVVYKHIQDFIINKFSSWYLEFLKFKNNNYFIHYLFREILIALHPYMPFVTDYLFQELYKEELLEYEPTVYKNQESFDLSNANSLIELITVLRKYREDKQISKNQTLNYFAENIDLSEAIQLIIFKLANYTLNQNNDFSIATSFGKIYIKQRQEDKENEIIELKKLIEKIKKEISFNEQFINNPKFMANADASKIKEKQDKLEFHKNNLLHYEEELAKKQ